MRWDRDPLWGYVYDWTVGHPVPGRLLWRVGAGSNLSLLYQATEEIGKLPPGSSVLDIPCGGGVALRGLRPGQGVRYIAADISPKMLERTSAEAGRLGLGAVETVIADVHDLQFADGEFDLVVSFTGLHCFPDPHRAIREIARVTRPGGRLVGSTLLRGSNLRSLPMHAVGRAAGLVGPGVSERQLRRWLDEAGYEHLDLVVSGAIGYFWAEAPKGVEQPSLLWAEAPKGVEQPSLRGVSKPS